MSKIAARELKSHTLDNIVEHHHGRPATAFWQARLDSIHCKGKSSTCSIWRCHLPSRTVFSPDFSSATEQTCGRMLIVVCVFPFIFVIDAALLFLHGIIFIVYAHSLGRHWTHFPAPHSLFYICFSLPIHILFLSVDCCIWPTIISLLLLLPPPLFRFPCLPRFHCCELLCHRPPDQPRDAARWEECSDLDEKSFNYFCCCDGRVKGIC